MVRLLPNETGWKYAAKCLLNLSVQEDTCQNGWCSYITWRSGPGFKRPATKTSKCHSRQETSSLPTANGKVIPSQLLCWGNILFTNLQLYNMLFSDSSDDAVLKSKVLSLKDCVWVELNEY